MKTWVLGLAASALAVLVLSTCVTADGEQCWWQSVGCTTGQYCELRLGSAPDAGTCVRYEGEDPTCEGSCSASEFCHNWGCHQLFYGASMTAPNNNDIVPAHFDVSWEVRADPDGYPSMKPFTIQLRAITGDAGVWQSDVLTTTEARGKTPASLGIDASVDLHLFMNSVDQEWAHLYVDQTR